MRRPGPVGPEDAPLVSRLPAWTPPVAETPEESAAGTPGPHRDPGGRTAREDGALPRSPDDSDEGWGGGRDPGDEERLTRERPPHW